MNLHINQRSFLADKVSSYFPNASGVFEKTKDLSYEKYQYLLSCYYNGEINQLRMELIKLGVAL